MDAKKIVWIGFFIGSTVGGMLPALWGDDMISLSSFILSFVGGAVGIWAGYRVSRSL